MGLLRHTLYDAPMQIKRVAYFTLCRPVLEYGSEAWDPYEKEQVTKLEVLQNKALRFIFNVKGRDVSMSELRQSQGIDSLEKRRKDARFRLLHSIIENDTLHPSLMATLDSMQSRECTRLKTFKPLHNRTNITHMSFIPRTTRELRNHQ